MNNNWIHKEGGDYHKKQADKNLKKIKEGRKGKTFTMVKVCDHPVTYKEIEVKG
jgi:hypothetical protein